MKWHLETDQKQDYIHHLTRQCKTLTKLSPYVNPKNEPYLAHIKRTIKCAICEYERRNFDKVYVIQILSTSGNTPYAAENQPNSSTRNHRRSRMPSMGTKGKQLRHRNTTHVNKWSNPSIHWRKTKRRPLEPTWTTNANNYTTTR